jgi:rare lipoprotein A (peptidoglycan hydrolase)
MVATWYAKGLKKPEAHTAASRTYPRGTKLRVTHRGNSVVVLINDYGPEPHTQAHLDLSSGAFSQLAPLSVGRIIVRVEVVFDPRKQDRTEDLRAGSD